MERKDRRLMLIGLDGADPYVIKKLMKAGRLPNFERAVAEGATTEGYDMIGT